MPNILIAEDERPIANLIRMTLKGAGYRCDWAPDGDRAADLAGVRCFRGVRAQRMDGFLCFCKWCCNSPGLAGASLASGVIWHLV